MLSKRRSYLAMLERIFQHSPEATFLFHVNVQTIITLNAAHTHFFYTKIHFFLKKFALFMRAVPLHSANHLYLRTPPVGNHSYLAMHRTNFPTFPRSYVRLMQPIRTFFYTKIHFFLKKFAYVHFL